ncbi:MAG: adenine deaminase [Desulfamplus sp.]|nr:adenine deaminase [Desulfamplus sp.]
MGESNIFIKGGGAFLRYSEGIAVYLEGIAVYLEGIAVFLHHNVMNIESIIAAAAGRKQADTLFVNGKVINVFTGEIREHSVAVKDGYICGVGYAESGSNQQNSISTESTDYREYDAVEIVDLQGMYLSPGFIDAHVHIESSMVTPEQFAKGVVPFGTTTVVADPHEIANVMGIAGIEYMMKSAQNQPMNILFSLPSCVPATNMETSGAVLDASVIAPLMKHDRIVALAEMMNYPGVIYAEPDVMAKLKVASKARKNVDGHAPGVTGKALCAYSSAGNQQINKAKKSTNKRQFKVFSLIRDIDGGCEPAPIVFYNVFMAVYPAMPLI